MYSVWKVGVTPVVDKMREARLRRFRHVRRRSIDALVRKCDRLILACTRRGKEVLGEVIVATLDLRGHGSG